MTVAYPDFSHDYPQSYTCLKCGAMVIPYKNVNAILKKNDTNIPAII